MRQFPILERGSSLGREYVIFRYVPLYHTDPEYSDMLKTLPYQDFS